mgnify:FL=1
MNILSVKNLTYIYNEDMEDEVTALSGVSFDVEEGEFIALVGANGSGKSTLARLLNGLREPSSGEVLVRGIPTTDRDRIFEVRSTVGVVFQNPDNQMVATIIEDDIAFGPENLGVEPAEIDRRVDWALECVGMKEHRKGTPFRLSGGQKQRIAIAGVLAIKPRVLVLDESTAMLDPRGKKEVMDTIERIREREGMTVIMITHFPEEAARADRVIALNKGRIVIDEPTHAALSDVERLRTYGLDAPLPARVAHELRLRGMPLEGEIVSAEELKEALWRLK